MAQLGDELCACPDWTPLEPRFRSRGSLRELVALPKARAALALLRVCVVFLGFLGRALFSGACGWLGSRWVTSWQIVKLHRNIKRVRERVCVSLGMLGRLNEVVLYCHSLDVGLAKVHHLMEAQDMNNLSVRVSSASTELVGSHSGRRSIRAGLRQQAAREMTLLQEDVQQFNRTV